ncbi:hypothetical protein K443DRAFT_133726 [Laccaria amethystina LaAM-08-1]|uniref:WSC domain-containing protein n=1 Tax=Laccaria amethystina LaAM-08-1 TaxID=1095629 RepID=A0A0C9WYA7_9AGAR|nr:hypothetical protein K443DRAFT_133726 [Laccaria amethystina LaAM-08-1]
MAKSKGTSSSQTTNTVPSTDHPLSPEAPPAYYQEDTVPFGGSASALSARQVEIQPLLLGHSHTNDVQVAQQKRAPEVRLCFRLMEPPEEAVVTQSLSTPNQANEAREAEIPHSYSELNFGNATHSDEWDQLAISKVNGRWPRKSTRLIAVAVFLVVFLAIFLPVIFVVVRKASNNNGAHVVQSPLAGWNPVGCYNDTGNPRTLPLTSAQMTPAQCLTYDCGYSIQSSATPENVKECDMACAGNSTQTCGGFWKIFIYSYGRPVTPVNKPLVNGLQYNGCYTDINTTSRSLKGTFFTDQLMTVEMCTSACTSNYKLAGLGFGSQCCKYSRHR